ncbi:hypothetical protein, partial [Stenotrophomonas maltophilia]|uniref:hypothetical protein n=1 Tax=Stenotrophomonas maltophilia TaxID=40324 RepID=UPI0013D9257A
VQRHPRIEHDEADVDLEADAFQDADGIRVRLNVRFLDEPAYFVVGASLNPDEDLAKAGTLPF